MTEVLDLLRRSAFFAAADDRELREISARLVRRRFRSGEVVIREGDDGDDCYLVHEGTASVAARDLIGQTVALTTYGEGDTFGELALAGPGRARSATVTAQTDLEVLAMDRATFDALRGSCPDFAAHAMDRLALLDADTFLRTASPLARLPVDTVARVARRVRVERVRRGDVVIAEGTAADALRVVRSGRLAATRGGRTLQTYGPGDAFGEIALLLGTARTATVRATTDAELVAIDRADFDALVREEPSFARLMRELAGIRGARTTASVSDAEADAAVPLLRATRRARWPWVAGGGTALFAALSLAAAPTDLVVAVGALVGPATFVAFVAENDLLPERPARLAATFALTGVVMVPLTSALEGLLGAAPGTAAGAAAVAIVEEAAKLAAIVPILRRTPYRSLARDGIVYGAAAGMGFAAVETLLYGRAAIASGGVVLGVLWARALLSPFGHGTWTAVAAAAILEGRARRARGVAVAGVGVAMGLHALWDAQPFAGAAGVAWLVLVGIGGLWLLTASASRATREAARSAVALAPELLAGAGASQVTCSNCGQLSLPGSHYCVRCGAALRAP